jgi:hypothetical protein
LLLIVKGANAIDFMDHVIEKFSDLLVFLRHSKLLTTKTSGEQTPELIPQYMSVWPLPKPPMQTGGSHQKIP